MFDRILCFYNYKKYKWIWYVSLWYVYFTLLWKNVFHAQKCLFIHLYHPAAMYKINVDDMTLIFHTEMEHAQLHAKGQNNKT